MSCGVSPKGDWIYGLDAEGTFYTFDSSNGKMVHLMKVHEKEPIGMTVHPHRTLIATFTKEGFLNFWK